MNRYMVLQERTGWLVARVGKAGPKVVTDLLPCSVACKVVNLLNDTFDADWTPDAVRRAAKIDPTWKPPIWLPDWIRYDYDPGYRRKVEIQIAHGS